MTAPRNNNENLNAMRTLQEEMSDEFEKAGINSEEDIQKVLLAPKTATNT